MRIGKKMFKKREKRAMSVSLYANLMFVVVELVMAIVTGSQAVLLDGVYDGIEFVMLLPSYLFNTAFYISRVTRNIRLGICRWRLCLSL